MRMESRQALKKEQPGPSKDKKASRPLEVRMVKDLMDGAFTICLQEIKACRVTTSAPYKCKHKHRKLPSSVK